MSFRKTLLIAMLAGACSGKAAPANPAEPVSVAPPEETQPAAATAESIIEAYVEATGGRAAREAVTSMRATGTMRIAKVGIGGKIEMLMKVPNLARITVDFEGVGRQESGSDGKTVWEKSAMAGARVVEGAERERTLRESMLHADLVWRELYLKVELQGEAEFEGRPVWKIARTTVGGEVETAYFDRETHLQLGTEAIAKTQMGDIPTRSYYASYDTYGGIKMVNKIVQTVQGMDIEITIDKVELNPTLPANAFAVPPDVVPLIK